MSLSAQTTWFKFVPGWRCNNSYISNDTIYSLNPTVKIDKNAVFGISMNRIRYIDGEILNSDSFFYQSSLITDLTNLEYRNKNNSLLNADKNNFLLAFNYGDSFASDIKWKSDIFSYPNFIAQNIQLNYDTFDTKIEGIFSVNGSVYALIWWEKKIDKLNSNSTCRLVKIHSKDSIQLIWTRLNIINNTEIHNINLDNVKSDLIDNRNLFLELSESWDYHGVPAQFESVVQKIDTNGKLIWESRPSGYQDTINTSGFQMVQMPSGNILCSWLDFYYRPWKKPNDPYQYELTNPNATMWFAEIDYKTGQRLWVKNIQQYLSWEMTPSDMEGRKDVTDLIFNDAQLIDGNSIVWCGLRSRTVKLTNSWKQLPVLIKTDLQGNPIWYREYNFFPADTGDKGFTPYSFIQTPDKGFLLSGEYQNRFGQLSKGEFWQKAALLKLDSNGCFEPGCNKTDNIINIQIPKAICKVFPNPISNYIKIEFPEGSSNWEISIYDINGKIVFQSQETITTIPSGDMPNGNYLIHIANKQNYHYETHKIIIQH